MEQKIAHLTFIQGIINRMGQNSFMIKGWNITIVAAIFALAAKDTNKSFILIAYFPTFMFWLLDTFFLQQEKLFRELYNQVATDNIKSNTFTLNTNNEKINTIKYWDVFLSKTLLPFYGFISIVILFVMFSILK
jgi:hypothetical protein